MAAFSKWRSAAAPTAADSLSPTEEFATFLQQHGVILKGPPEIDGTWHRAPLEDDKAGAKSASYRAFLDGRPNGQIHNYKTGQTHMRSEEHTSELQSLMRNSYAVFCLKQKNKNINHRQT